MNYRFAGTTRDLAKDCPGNADVWRPVVDKSGMEGTYIFRLAAGCMLAALREQLGLKFVRRKAPMDVLAISRIERPNPN